ncbi:MAG: hypothetical protein OXG27_08070 [Chloroflexi bacterium]|nr:hypothetical protein [Chloroflexota bacterium]
MVGLLRSAGLWDRPDAWRLLGDEPDNYRIVGAQASEAEAALAEKLTNAIDANLMRRCLEEGIDPKGPDAPQSVREAVARFYDVGSRGSYSGSLAEWDNPKILRVARSTTRVSISGDRRRQIKRQQNHPSVTVLDYGEGQAPENHPGTLLSIGQSLKLGIPFQHGKFNMGGTAALRFCGQKHLQLILSKRAPRIAAQEGVSTDWGFTIVRKDYTPGERMSVYRYLAPVDGPEGEVIRFAADSLPIGPDGNSPYVEEVESGTLIKLYQYQTEFRGQFGRDGGLRQELDVWLPVIPLPVRLHGRRSAQLRVESHRTEPAPCECSEAGVPRYGRDDGRWTTSLLRALLYGEGCVARVPRRTLDHFPGKRASTRHSWPTDL